MPTAGNVQCVHELKRQAHRNLSMRKTTWAVGASASTLLRGIRGQPAALDTLHGLKAAPLAGDLLGGGTPRRRALEGRFAGPSRQLRLVRGERQGAVVR